MSATWVQRLSAPVWRNLPSRKPQLWEDLALTIRRRAQFEVCRRLLPGWLDGRQIVNLSNVGFHDDGPPLRLELVPRESINQAMFLYGSFEIAETRLLQALLQPGMTFVDVGANIGYYTAIAARIVGSEGAVFSFEPNDPVRARLETNVRLNRFQNVVVRREALATHSGEVSFYPSAWGLNDGISSILPGNGRGEPHAVPAISLDALAGELGNRRIDVIKMDIEGAEPMVIAGGQATLAAANAPALIFEAADLEPAAQPLRAHGYHIRRLHYTLSSGLELLDPTAPFDDLFAAYEAPNYFAAKDEGLFSTAVRATNGKRARALQLLGRL